MPVYLISLHAYRSWRPDHPSGYVRRGRGILEPDPEMARHYDEAAKQPPVIFTDRHQQVLIAGAIDIASRRNWRIHAIGNEPTHIHILVSWRGDAHATTWKFVHDTFKRLLGMMLTQHFKPGTRGNKWFVRKGSRRRVRDRKHFNHLIETYLPKHRGRFWSERQQRAT